MCSIDMSDFGRAWSASTFRGVRLLLASSLLYWLGFQKCVRLLWELLNAAIIDQSGEFAP